MCQLIHLKCRFESNHDTKVDNYLNKLYNHKRKGASDRNSLTPIVT